MLPFRTIVIDTAEIRDWPSFHAVFARELGFPEFYGRNMDAWIDCMTSLDRVDDGMTTIHAPDSGVLVLELKAMDAFVERHPQMARTIEECSAFVHWRRIEVGRPPVLVLSYS